MTPPPIGSSVTLAGHDRPSPRASRPAPRPGTQDPRPKLYVKERPDASASKPRSQRDGCPSGRSVRKDRDRCGLLPGATHPSLPPSQPSTNHNQLFLIYIPARKSQELFSTFFACGGRRGVCLNTVLDPHAGRLRHVKERLCRQRSTGVPPVRVKGHRLRRSVFKDSVQMHPPVARI